MKRYGRWTSKKKREKKKIKNKIVEEKEGKEQESKVEKKTGSGWDGGRKNRSERGWVEVAIATQRYKADVSRKTRAAAAKARDEARRGEVKAEVEEHKDLLYRAPTHIYDEREEWKKKNNRSTVASSSPKGAAINSLGVHKKKLIQPHWLGSAKKKKKTFFSLRLCDVFIS